MIADATILGTANAYADHGLSVLPIRPDGTKAPACPEWETYQDHIATEAERRKMFAGRIVGVGIIGGRVSGRLEIIDFDKPEFFEPFCNEVELLSPGLIARLPQVATPRENNTGRQLFYRCEEIEGNQALAEFMITNPTTGKPQKKASIETRGEGGYVVTVGSPPRCHASGLSYRHVGGPPLTQIPMIEVWERATLFRVARSFTEVVEEPSAPTRTNGYAGLSPGDDFNRRASWADVIEPHGWTLSHVRGAIHFWRRPGKEDPGWSATTGVLSGEGNDLLCVFSTSADPFEVPINKKCGTFTKFAAHTLLNCAGDYSAAAKDLASKGYGNKRHEGNGKVDHAKAEQQQPTERIEYRRLTCRDLDAAEYNTEFLVEHTLVAGQPCIIAGSKKTLKTSLLIDLGISMARAGYFLGKLRCTRSARVAIMSGESGLATLQETARRIAAASGCNLADIDGLIWSPDLPMFGDIFHADALKRFLTDDEIEVVILDPAYLCIPTDGNEGSLFAVGKLLRNMSDACQSIGVTMILAHHTKKGVVDPFAPVELEDIAWAGFPEFARQWLLISRRQKYEPGTGEHRLWLNVGGSAGHSALWGVDISEGKYDGETPRRWGVELRPAAEVREEAGSAVDKAKAEKADQQLERDKKSLVETIGRCQNGETKTAIRDRSNMSHKRFNAALYALIEDGQIVEIQTTKGNNRTYEGYRLAD